MSGVFLLLKNNSSIGKSNIINAFNKAGFDDMVSYHYQSYTLWKAKKIIFEFPGAYYQDESQNSIHIFGTCCLPDIKPEETARILLERHITGKLNKQDLKGGFCIIINHNGSLILMRDPSRIYQIYQSQGEELLSSSFHIICDVTTKKSLDELAIRSNLICGFIPTPDTQYHEIKRPVNIDLPDITNIDLAYEIEKKPDHNSFQDHVRFQSDSILDYMKDVSTFMNECNISVGLSGGYDSRLLISAASRYNTKIQAFTFFKKNDPDPLIAKMIATACNMRIAMPEYHMTGKMSDSELSNVMHDAYVYFDSRISSMMEYIRHEYTLKYRKENLKDINLVIGGVGGEIYRNQNLTSRGLKYTTEDWINRFLIGPAGDCILLKKEKTALIAYLKKRLIDLLGSNINHSFNYYNAKEFYIKCWLPDWHGLRLSAENRALPFLSPFTDYTIAHHSLLSSKYHGYCGEFEAAIIKNISPELADLPSSYGHSFSYIPFSYKMKEWIRIHVPMFLKKLSFKRKGMEQSVNKISEHDSIKECMHTIGKFIPSNNIHYITHNRELFNTAVSLGYIINQHEKDYFSNN